MHRHLLVVLGLLLPFMGSAQTQHTVQQPDPDAIRQSFDQKYKDYLKADSQLLLPFPALEKRDWKDIQLRHPLEKLYTDPDRFYNNKIYTFTLYQASDDGTYYLDAKGGFWGMDELIYGPINEHELK